ncbi:hypothetical protein PR202_ga28597 [Eleusine coracana subsp. coracana]|uniref:Uncharacterized protein n=1 Tax=Eleusine coracana subsp. coracana TaxID=191504 RepID=A0AAV5DHJ4_ELECO|nr:hypothetical protein PR202_ga28597 [Eleusine coracana subsp. coracana]
MKFKGGIYETCTGDAVCRKKSIELLEELGLPKGWCKGRRRSSAPSRRSSRLFHQGADALDVPDASPAKVTFKTGTGLSDTFDATAFALGE